MSTPQVTSQVAHQAQPSPLASTHLVLPSLPATSIPTATALTLPPSQAFPTLASLTQPVLTLASLTQPAVIIPASTPAAVTATPRPSPLALQDLSTHPPLHRLTQLVCTPIVTSQSTHRPLVSPRQAPQFPRASSTPRAQPSLQDSSIRAAITTAPYPALLTPLEVSDLLGRSLFLRAALATVALLLLIASKGELNDLARWMTGMTSKAGPSKSPFKPRNVVLKRGLILLRYQVIDTFRCCILS